MKQMCIFTLHISQANIDVSGCSQWNEPIESLADCLTFLTFIRKPNNFKHLLPATLGSQTFPFVFCSGFVPDNLNKGMFL
jgi:hypothetical protein